ncbi:hypothetical protein DPMN_148618 [Dreissena polymorpha]|uniref:Uncharacterized protein n=1 Tax=Dreissena polymorpha TaxID=45954 RepID=A0A9D4FB77_DREPO|nr:hypothetical protein DPMN_148618 [Dreissena polymorpha]
MTISMCCLPTVFSIATTLSTCPHSDVTLTYATSTRSSRCTFRTITRFSTIKTKMTRFRLSTSCSIDKGIWFLRAYLSLFRNRNMHACTTDASGDFANVMHKLVNTLTAKSYANYSSSCEVHVKNNQTFSGTQQFSPACKLLLVAKLYLPHKCVVFTPPTTPLCRADTQSLFSPSAQSTIARQSKSETFNSLPDHDKDINVKQCIKKDRN